jgi:hypothetical protein
MTRDQIGFILLVFGASTLLGMAVLSVVDWLRAAQARRTDRLLRQAERKRMAKRMALESALRNGPRRRVTW